MQELHSMSDQLTYEKSKVNALDKNPYENIEGSPYLNEIFVPGEVIINDSIRVEEVPVRYNIYTDRIEFKDEEDQILEIDISQDDFVFKVANLTFTNEDYRLKNEKKQGLLEMLVDGHVQLFRKYNVKFQEAKKAKGYQDPEPKRFVRKKEQYLVAIGDEHPETFQKSKDLIKKLEKINPDVHQYIDSENLKIRKEEDLVQLVQHCNNFYQKDR
ncbi:MAG: hypothetical protein ACOC1E_00420 [Marinilabiliaceae bacterium]